MKVEVDTSLNTVLVDGAQVYPVPAPIPPQPGIPAPGTILTTDLDLTGKTDWTIQGVTFNGCRLKCGGDSPTSVRGKVINCTFNDSPAQDDNGCCVALSFADGVTISYCNFNRSAGGAIGKYGINNITMDHCRFVDCFSVWGFLNGDPDLGKNIQFTNNYISGEKYGGLETGGDTQAFTNLLVAGNTFVNLNGLAMIGPISIVARPNFGCVIKNNYFERGPNYFNNTPPPYFSQAVEIYGPVEVYGNTIVDFSSAFGVYGTGANIHDNFVYNTPADTHGSTVLHKRPTPPVT